MDIRSEGKRPVRKAALSRLLRPRSVAIIGASANPASMGFRALASLDRFGFDGEIFLVNPKRPIIGDRQCIGSVDELPMGVDAAILSIPQAAVEETLRAAIARDLGGAVLFSAGYAELGENGQAAQDQIAALAREGGVALAGPNCLGLVNYADNVPLTSGPVLPRPLNGGTGLAVLAQSGGIMGCVINASEARGIPLSYAISTGNEAVLSIIDYFEQVVEESNTSGVMIFAEQLRAPDRFLDLARRARALGKPVILLHSGKSDRAREASLSHTGAVASNFAAMKASVEAEGVILVDGIDSLVDVAELVSNFGKLPHLGAGIVTDSGAFKGLALDFGEDMGLALPELAPKTFAALRNELPDFVEPSNPLDLTGQAMSDIDTFYVRTGEELAGDPNIDVLLYCLLPGAGHVVNAKAEAVARIASKLDIPVVCVFLGNGAPLPPEARETLQKARVPLFQSGEQAIRAVARLLTLGDTPGTTAKPSHSPLSVSTPPRTSGALPEYEGKAWLAQTIGLPIPKGTLAQSREAAISAANQLGYPVVMKIQHADLMHKSDVGGVVVGIDDADAAGAAWDRIMKNLEAAHPGHPRDGILVEAMGDAGVELVLGAMLDPQWGPMLLVGLGGIWIEVLKDVQLLPAGASSEAIKHALLNLKGAKLLTGYRGKPPVDINAVAALADRLGQLLLAETRITEIDLNPIIALPEGQGVVALDALVAFEATAKE